MLLLYVRYEIFIRIFLLLLLFFLSRFTRYTVSLHMTDALFVILYILFIVGNVEK